MIVTPVFKNLSEEYQFLLSLYILYLKLLSSFINFLILNLFILLYLLSFTFIFSIYLIKVIQNPIHKKNILFILSYFTFLLLTFRNVIHLSFIFLSYSNFIFIYNDKIFDKYLIINFFRIMV